ncbi:MAG: amidohydrolase family protein [Bernardetiaceae bacterium]|nr:amidohydrolase family protein [Bernardetiaceae bacterium]
MMKEDISRRDFLSRIGKVALLSPLYSLSQNAWAAAVLTDNAFKYVIANTTIFEGAKERCCHIGIKHDNSILISSDPLQADKVIDGTNYITSAGFIDILADNGRNTEQSYTIFEEYKLADGVTTALQMHGGHHNAHYYYNHFREKQHWINYGVSTKVMRIRTQYKSLKERLRKVEENLADGALGVSHSIEYQPTPTQETVAYAQLAQKYNRPLFLHLRYSSAEKELEGIKEAIDIAKQTGVSVHIDHINSTGGTFNMEKALTLIREAISQGLHITACVYPYSYWATYVPSTRFGPGWKQRYGISYEDLEVVGTGQKLTKSLFYKYRKEGYWRLVAVPEGTMDMKKTVDLALQEDFCMIGSDGGIERSRAANNHPRGAGCFATALHHGTKIGIPLHKMLEKMTSMPQKLIGAPLAKRGKIKNGYLADLVVFDKNKVNGKANVANPNQYSEGIEAVFVNGELAYYQGKLKAKKGQPIRHKKNSLAIE